MNGTDDISFLRFSPALQPELLEPLVQCYREVFSALPWGEWKKCPACDKVWGIEDRDVLMGAAFKHCGTEVQDFWPADVVRGDILHELVGSASCWIAMQGENLVGFCWGYEVTAEQLESKLKLPGLAEMLHAEFGPGAHYAYQDEMGVVASLRGKKLARKMFDYRLGDFLNQGLTIGVVRTKTKPPSVTHQWFTRPGYEYRVVGEYHDAAGRVVLARRIDNLGVAHYPRYEEAT